MPHHSWGSPSKCELMGEILHQVMECVALLVIHVITRYITWLVCLCKWMSVVILIIISEMSGAWMDLYDYGSWNVWQLGQGSPKYYLSQTISSSLHKSRIISDMYGKLSLSLGGSPIPWLLMQETNYLGNGWSLCNFLNYSCWCCKCIMERFIEIVTIR